MPAWSNLAIFENRCNLCQACQAHRNHTRPWAPGNQALGAGKILPAFSAEQTVCKKNAGGHLGREPRVLWSGLSRIPKDFKDSKGFLTHKARVVRVHVFPTPFLSAEKSWVAISRRPKPGFPAPKAWFDSQGCCAPDTGLADFEKWADWPSHSSK